MKLKDYDKPTMKVVKIQTTKMLMTSNQNGQTGVQNYDWNEYEE